MPIFRLTTDRAVLLHSLYTFSPHQTFSSLETDVYGQGKKTTEK